jgi:phosphatidylglycerol:prolipoprotein diacylglycerol transferase
MSTQVEISFPGLGIENFTVNKIAFEVFGFDIRWYGILIVFGMIAAFAYAIFRSKQEGFTADDVLDVGLYTVIFGVLGARLYYVLMKWDTFVIPGRPLIENLKALFNIRGGGLAIYGGVIAGALTVYIYTKIKKRAFWSALDMITPGVMIAQAMGRWGNFFNGEAYGGIVTEGDFLYFLRMGLSPNKFTYGEMAYVHPTFLYESLWNIVGFALINLLVYPKKKFNGQVAMTYFAWYGFGRMLVEGLRSDSLYIGTIRVSQLVGFLCFVVFTILIIYRLIRVKKAALAEAGETYVPMYGTIAQEDEATEVSEVMQQDEDDFDATAHSESREKPSEKAEASNTTEE